MISASKTPANKTVNLTELKTTIHEKTEWPMMMEVDPETLAQVYYLDQELYNQAVVEASAVSVHASELIMIEAKDGKIADVKQAIDKRLEDAKQTWSRYLPEQYDLVLAAQTVESGNYLFVVIHPEAEAIVEIINTAIK